jgi:hypothetical protein
MSKALSTETMRAVLRFQRDEVASAAIYHRLSRVIPDAKNAEIIARMAEEERKHASRWQSVSGVEIRPPRVKIFLFFLIARVLGITFAIKKLENAESQAQGVRGFWIKFPTSRDHSRKRIAMRMPSSHDDEERLRYAGLVVLGLTTRS